MECGISNETGRALIVSVNGKAHTVESGDDFYADIPEEESAVFEVRSVTDEEEKKIKKILMLLYHFFLSPVVLFTRADELEIKQNVGLAVRFEIKPTEKIRLVDADDSFALCNILTENRLYEGEYIYTKDELKKSTKDFLLNALLTVLGAALYIFAVVFILDLEKRKQTVIIVTACACLPIVWLCYNAIKTYLDFSKRLEAENE